MGEGEFMFFELLIVFILSMISGLIVIFANEGKIKKGLFFFVLLFISGLFIDKIIIIAFLLTMPYYVIRRSKKYEEHFAGKSSGLSSLGIFFLVLLACFCFCEAAALAIEPGEEIFVEITSKNLETLKVGNSLSGSFFLGSGSINNNEYYIYNYLKDKELLQEKVSKSPSVRVFIDDSIEKPVVRYYRFYKFSKTKKFWEIYTNEKPKKKYLRSETKFFIPSNSLITGIDI